MKKCTVHGMERSCRSPSLDVLRVHVWGPCARTACHAGTCQEKFCKTATQGAQCTRHQPGTCIWAVGLCVVHLRVATAARRGVPTGHGGNSDLVSLKKRQVSPSVAKCRWLRILSKPVPPFGRMLFVLRGAAARGVHTPPTRNMHEMSKEL